MLILSQATTQPQLLSLVLLAIYNRMTVYDLGKHKDL